MDCSDCLIGNDCYGYDPSGRAGPPDVETCRIFGIDCSGGAGDSSNIRLMFKPLIREKELR